ncbi:MAG: tetratricopeptide repeat protein [Muribaculaceae bacterium]|nr:tetratricopeptide repeat protein [Muribaculaceae bacterium]
MFGWVKNLFGKVKDLDGSVDAYREDSIIQSLPTVAYVNKAKKLVEDKDFEAAEVILKKALDISTQDSLVYKYLGKIYEYRSDFEQAVKYYESSKRINPQDKEIWLRLGLSRLNCGMVEGAIKAFEKADKVTPFNTDVKTGWGMALMKQNKFALARDKFVEATRISKYNYTAILLSAIMDIRLYDYEPAEMKLAFLSKVAPNESSTYEYSNLKLLKEDYKEAENFAKKSIEINRQMLPAYFVLGEVYSKQNDLENTEKIFEKALYNDLDCARLHFEWGRAYLRFFDFEKAEAQLKLAVQMDENYTAADICLALIDSMNGSFERLDGLKERNGDSVYIQEAMGIELVNAGRLEDAVEMFKKALRTDKSQFYNLFHLAKTYSAQNKKDETKDYFEKFIVACPWSVGGYVEFAKWLISIADFADAHRKLRKAEKLDEDNIELLNLLFFTSYTLVKENICEYNIKEAISLANRIKDLGTFDYEQEYTELENILVNIHRTN